jgi:hypothetical protein
MAEAELIPYGAEWQASDLTDVLCRLGLDHPTVAAALGVETAELTAWSEGHSPAPKMALIALAYLASSDRARMAALAHRDIERPAEQWMVVQQGDALANATVSPTCVEAMEFFHAENQRGKRVELWHAVMLRAGTARADH